MTHQILYRLKGGNESWKPFSEYNSRLAARTAVRKLTVANEDFVEFRMADPHGYITLARRVGITAAILFVVACVFALGYVTGVTVAVYR